MTEPHWCSAVGIIFCLLYTIIGKQLYILLLLFNLNHLFPRFIHIFSSMYYSTYFSNKNYARNMKCCWITCHMLSNLKRYHFLVTENFALNHNSLLTDNCQYKVWTVLLTVQKLFRLLSMLSVSRLVWEKQKYGAMIRRLYSA